MFCQVALIHVPKFGEVRRVTAKAAEATELLLRCARADLNVAVIRSASWGFKSWMKLEDKGLGWLLRVTCLSQMGLRQLPYLNGSIHFFKTMSEAHSHHLRSRRWILLPALLRLGQGLWCTGCKWVSAGRGTALLNSYVMYLVCNDQKFVSRK